MSHKLRIYYTEMAYRKTLAIVHGFETEVAWHMMVYPYMDGYKVHDIEVYPQKASAGYVEVDLNKWALWRNDLANRNAPFEQNMFGQGHSHVNMETFVSGTDRNSQNGEIAMKKNGFYLFQIWNKKGDINTIFYDVNRKTVYNRDDIDLIVEYPEDETVEEFVERTAELVEKKDKIFVNGVEINEFSEVV